jgi:hypothetical protein
MKYKEILKLLFFSIATAGVTRYIAINVIWKSMENNRNNFHKNLINVTTYQQKVVETVYFSIFILFVLPYIAAIIFYFFSKINLRPKYNFLIFILMFTILYFLFYILIGYSYKF